LELLVRADKNWSRDPRFGKFIVRKKEARRGRNPATGEDLTLEQRRVIMFKCSTVMRDRINMDGRGQLLRWLYSIQLFYCGE
jgi:hypothetical protein